MSVLTTQVVNTLAQKRWPGRWNFDPVRVNWSEDAGYPHRNVEVRASVGILWMEMSLKREISDFLLLTQPGK